MIQEVYSYYKSILAFLAALLRIRLRSSAFFLASGDNSFFSLAASFLGKTSLQADEITSGFVHSVKQTIKSP